MQKVIDKIIRQEDLTIEEMTESMMALMSGEVDPVIAASFLTALKMKTESVEEIVAGARVLREKASKITINKEITMDTCGTGGDSSGTFNISTAVAIILAAEGVAVVKHGNRSVSSQCGCADVLEELGVAIDITPEQVKACVDEVNIGFLFAPTFHSAMRHVGPVRRTLGFRTIFNILGPLANPANASYQLVGVFDEKLLEVFAKVLNELGVKRALVVHGDDGLDEITLSTTTKLCELNQGVITTKTIRPEDFGLTSSSLESIKGGDKVVNARILNELFDGKKGPMRDVLLLNAGAALYTCERVSSMEEGIALAASCLDEKKAKHKLAEFILKTQELKRG
jgi:anthranilate phosphoribosyltransferase